MGQSPCSEHRDSAPWHKDLEGYHLGISEGELRGPFCQSCGAFQWPPRPVCTQCLTDRLIWRRLPELGSLYSWIEVSRTDLKPWRPRIPYVVALIDVVEAGIRIFGALNLGDASLRPSMNVRWSIDLTQSGGVIWSPVPVNCVEG
jgi:uncharacterized OB-fold protein